MSTTHRFQHVVTLMLTTDWERVRCACVCVRALHPGFTQMWEAQQSVLSHLLDVVVR